MGKIILEMTYHTQRNNKLFPYSTCGTTSVATILGYLNKAYGKNYVHDDDEVFKKLNEQDMIDRLRAYVSATPEDDDWMLEYTKPVRTGGYTKMNNLMIMLSFVAQKLTDNEFAFPMKFRTFDEIRLGIKNGKMPYLCSGKFSPSGHFVVICGYSEDTGNFIFNDPYGVYPDYKEEDGHNAEYNLKKMLSNGVWKKGYHLSNDGKKLNCLKAVKIS